MLLFEGRAKVVWILVSDFVGCFSYIVALVSQQQFRMVHLQLMDVLENRHAKCLTKNSHQFAGVGAEVSCQRSYRMSFQVRIVEVNLHIMTQITGSAGGLCLVIIKLLKLGVKLKEYDLDD